METILIVAVAKGNNGIGKDNDLLWRLPADMKYFREQTTGYPVITGRKNYESIPEKFRPLPDRHNIIVTRQDLNFENASVCHSLEEAIELAKQDGKEKIFIIGGGQIYKQALDNGLVDKMLVTWVDADIDADTFFPAVDETLWELTHKSDNQSDEKNPFSFSFTEYVKK